MALDRSKLCHELTVEKKIREARDAHSIAFAIPADLKEKFHYRAGQFVTLFMDIDGEEIRRSYSLCTSPDYDTEFKITIKKVKGGKGSTHLVDKVKVGDKLWVTPPAGLFCLPKELDTPKLVFYAAGSGITPIISLLKSALKSTEISCSLFYQNREAQDVIFQEELKKLSTEYGARLQIEYCLTIPDSGWDGMCGRIDKNSLRDFLTRNKAGIRALHFMCGPAGFMATIEDSLKALAVGDDRIFKESFTIAEPQKKSEGANDSAAPEIPLDAILIGDKSQQAACETLEVSLEGETHTLPYKKDSSILETLLEADLNPPYSCMDGACMACIAKVEDGLVYQSELGILSDDNVEAKETLTCQARPLSKKVRIKYEIF